MKSSCPEGCKRYVDEVCGDSLVVDLVVLGELLDLVILRVLSNLGDSMIP